MNIPNKRAAELHACYEALTGIQIPLNRLWDIEPEWGRWMAQGWTEADLRLVVNHIKRTYSGPKYYLPALRFDRLIEDHRKFAMLLGEAKAVQRNTPAPQFQRDKALASLVVASPEAGKRQQEPRQAGMTAQQIVDGLQKFRKESGI